MDTDPTRPLTNARREAFVQALAGEANGDAEAAYVLAGYSPKGARQNSARLMQDETVYARVEHVRRQLIRHEGCDALWLLRQRKAIAEAQLLKEPSTALAALRDIEKSLGLTPPVKIRQWLSAKVETETPDRPKLTAEAEQRLAELAADFRAMPLPPEAEVPP